MSLNGKSLSKKPPQTVIAKLCLKPSMPHYLRASKIEIIYTCSVASEASGERVSMLLSRQRSVALHLNHFTHTR